MKRREETLFVIILSGWLRGQSFRTAAGGYGSSWDSNMHRERERREMMSLSETLMELRHALRRRSYQMRERAISVKRKERERD